MVWLSSLENSQYFNHPSGIDCYCETILQPYDLYLQGVLDTNGSPTYQTRVEVYKPNGEFLEDASTYFQFFYGVNTLGRHYFVGRMKSYSASMCNNVCWILKVTVYKSSTIYFDYYTERYCSPDCCAQPNGVTLTDGLTEAYPTPQGNIIIPGNGVDEDTFTPTRPLSVKDPCGKSYLYSEIFSDCYSVFTGNMYKHPNVIQGSKFDYVEKSNINAFIRSMPATIDRTYSLNCRLQRAQKFDVFQLQGKELYPTWKMKELQNWFTNQYLFLNGERYEMDSTEMFELTIIPNSCIPMYRLNVQLRRCNVKQIFGCGVSCEANSMAFIVPSNIGQGMFDENKQYIGSTVEDLQTYFNSQMGVQATVEIEPVDYDCDFNFGITVTSLPQAYIPTSIYAGGIMPNNRVFGINPDNLPYLCTIITPSCETPVIGSISNEETVCVAPMIGSITNEAAPNTDLYITGFGDWTNAGSDATLSVNTVTINLKVDNTTISYDDSDPEAVLPYVSGQIGYISEVAWPATDKIVNNAEVDAAGGTLIIQSNGAIFYSGQVTSGTLGGVTIDFENVIYTLP